MISDDLLDKTIDKLLDGLYSKRQRALEGLTLSKLLDKNPYLYRSMGYVDPTAYIDALLAARISSSDETIFGNDFLEPLALWSAKAATEHKEEMWAVTVGAGAGQDIAIETANAYMAISVKSGKNIYNSQSNKGQSVEFDALQSRLKKLNKNIRPIIGYGYGRKITRKETNTEKVAGQKFWALLTGEEDYYLRIGASIGKYTKDHADAYLAAYNQKKLQLIREFMIDFVSVDGEILWDNVIKYNSAEIKPKLTPKKKAKKLD